MLPQHNYLLLYYIRGIIVYLFAPVAHQRNKEGDATGKKNNASGEPQHIIVREALRDEKDGADKEQQPADKMITLLRIIDCCPSYLTSTACTDLL